MKYLVLFLAFHFCLAAAPAQIRRYNTQAEIDNSNSVYGIRLIIGPDTCCSDIHDLSPLGNFWGTDIGILIRNNPHLQSLHGLEQLNYMQYNGKIEIINNDSLTNLVGLTDSIGHFPTTDEKSVGFVIEDNERLVDLQGIPDCSRAQFQIRRNPALTSLNGCQNLDYLLGLTIENCSNLQSLSGLQAVDTLAGGFLVHHCPRLKNLQGLNSCRKIGYPFQFNRLDSLENTDGLGNLRYTNMIWIDSCARFRALTDLERLGRGYFGDWIAELRITNCPWFGDFSGLSDTAYFETAYLFQMDSIETVKNFQRLHANASGIWSAYNLKYLDALPTGITSYSRAPSCGASNCPNLTYIRDTIPGRVDTMYNLGFALCPKLTDITGFKYVKGVTHQMGLRDFAQDSLIGLENLQWSRWISIFDCTLNNLQFLSSLDSVVVFDIGDSIASLAGLENLRTVEYLGLLANNVLKDLSPVEDSTRTQKSLGLSYLTNLDSISGFNLPQLMGQNNMDDFGVRIESCTVLKSISGFNGLTSFTKAIISQPYDNIAVVNHPTLQSITGFQNLVYLKKGLNISNNSSLSDISGLCNLFQNGAILGIKTIQDNAPGANSYDEALDLCNISGSREPDNRTTILLYPNPASTEFIVRFTGAENAKISSIIVSDLAGRIQLIAKVESRQTVIPCSTLPSGIYAVQVLSEGVKSLPAKLVISTR